jgi:hypothetical protein
MKSSPSRALSDADIGSPIQCAGHFKASRLFSGVSSHPDDVVTRQLGFPFLGF